MDFEELGLIAAFGAAIAFSIVFIMTYFLSSFVALKKAPKERALWTVGVSYVGYLALLVSSLPSQYILAAVSLSVPTTFIIYLHFKRSFVKLWYDDPNMIPEHMKLANDDWRVPLYLLLAVAVVVGIKKAFAILAL